MKILLDSDVIINLLKTKDETIKKLKSFEDAEFFISPISIAEIYAGAFESDIDEIEKLFSFFIKVDIDEDIAKVAGSYANRYKKAFNKISLEDYLIAATCKIYKLTLWSYNKKHYPMDDIELI